MDRLNKVVPPNSGASFEVRRGQVLAIWGATIVDLVVFDLNDPTHRFDQARTKANQGTIYITEGDRLISNRNRDMLYIVEDGFREGHHDLQYGLCSRERWLWAVRNNVAASTYLREEDHGEVVFPEHGCLENIASAVTQYGIAIHDIPSPLNLFQNMSIDGETGVMRHTAVRPSQPVPVRLRALMDCLGAVSACPDLLVGGQQVRLSVADQR